MHGSPEDGAEPLLRGQGSSFRVNHREGAGVGREWGKEEDEREEASGWRECHEQMPGALKQRAVC